MKEMILKPVSDDVNLDIKKPRGKVYTLVKEFQDSNTRVVEVVNDGTYSNIQSMYTSLWTSIKNNNMDREGIALKMVDGKVYLINESID